MPTDWVDRKVLEVIDDDQSAASDKKLKREADLLPDFFVCGAAKAGTTSLWHYLRQHPSIFMPAEKEPAYFSGLRDRYNWHQYAALFASASQSAITGEASTNYLTSPDSAPRIQRVVPEARIIIILRDPVERAFSLYRWMVKHGYEHARSFRTALKLERKRARSEEFIGNNDEYFYNYLYHRSGLYAKQVERYLTLFDDSSVKIILFSNFVKNTTSKLKSLYRFLGVDASFSPKLRIRNEGVGVWFPSFQYFLHQTIRPTLRKTSVPGYGHIVNWLDYINEKGKTSDIDEDLRYSLLDKYRSSFEKIKEVTGVNVRQEWAN